MIISIVGKSGSGKSTIAKILQQHDKRLLHVDIDRIAHQVLNIFEVKEALRNAFSTDVVIDDEVQRKVLGRIVFATPEAMKKLTDITWKHMEYLIDEIIINNPDKIIILDYVLLPKTKYFQNSAIKIWVEAPIEDRLDRVIKRAIGKEEIDKNYILKRDNSAIDYEEGIYDFVIDNSNNNDVRSEVKKIYEKSILCR